MNFVEINNVFINVNNIQVIRIKNRTIEVLLRDRQQEDFIFNGLSEQENELDFQEAKNKLLKTIKSES